MKIRESGMPEEETWRSFFDPASALRELGVCKTIDDLVEFGCGYGTFTIPAAQIIAGSVHAFDVEPEMIARSMQKAEAAGLTNIHFHLRDFMVQGTGLRDGSVDYVMVFNILNTAQPLVLLRESQRVLAHGGTLGIMHWKYDATTPRGPSMEIRPKPQQCRDWAVEAGFQIVNDQINLPPYHYGVVARKP